MFSPSAKPRIIVTVVHPTGAPARAPVNISPHWHSTGVNASIAGNGGSTAAEHPREMRNRCRVPRISRLFSRVCRLTVQTTPAVVLCMIQACISTAAGSASRANTLLAETQFTQETAQETAV
jgi:hypothetical protein